MITKPINTWSSPVQAGSLGINSLLAVPLEADLEQMLFFMLSVLRFSEHPAILTAVTLVLQHRAECFLHVAGSCCAAYLRESNLRSRWNIIR